MTDINDDLRAMEAALRGIKAPRGEGNGYNMPGGRRKLAARIRDAQRRRPGDNREGEE